MSFERVDAVLQLNSDLSPAHRIILLLLAQHVRSDGPDEAWPSVPTLSKHSGLGDRQVRRVLRSLEEDGWISRRGHKSNVGTHIYLLSKKCFRAQTRTPESAPPDMDVRPRTSATVTPDMGVRQSRDEQGMRCTPPTPPGGGGDRARLTEAWTQVAEAARGNPSTTAVLPRKFGPTQLRQLRKIDEYLDGDWDALREAVASVVLDDELTPLNCSMERLASNDCAKLGGLLDGNWKGERKQEAKAETRLDFKQRLIDQQRFAHLAEGDRDAGPE